MRAYEQRVRLLLQDHLRSSRELLGLDRELVGPAAAQEALLAAQDDLQRVSRIARDRCMAEELRQMAYGIANVSRQIIRMKRLEFAGSGGDEGYGGAAVSARLSPTPPGLVGRDAKPLQRDED